MHTTLFTFQSLFDGKLIFDIVLSSAMDVVYDNSECYDLVYGTRASRTVAENVLSEKIHSLYQQHQV